MKPFVVFLLLLALALFLAVSFMSGYEQNRNHKIRPAGEGSERSFFQRLRTPDVSFLSYFLARLRQGNSRTTNCVS